jgi:hypothetical protein
MARRLLALALVVLLNCGAGFSMVGDSVTHDARQELAARGGRVLSAPGIFLQNGRPGIRRLVAAGRRRIVVELGLMDVSFGESEAVLRRRVRAILRDDLAGVPCVVWLDLGLTANVHPQWRARAGAFNALLGELTAQYGDHVAHWSWMAERRRRQWFRRDGIHLTAAGQRGYAAYVAGRAEHFCS